MEIILVAKAGVLYQRDMGPISNSATDTVGKSADLCEPLLVLCNMEKECFIHLLLI